VLKGHSEDNIIATFGAVDENGGRAHAEVGSTFGHLEARIDARAALAKRDFESIGSTDRAAD
jgi:hypothetical protein